MMNDIAIKSQKETEKIERKYMVKSSRILYTALEDLDFHWDMDQIEEFKKMWRKGYSIVDIAEHLDRPQEEVAVLLLDQSMKSFVRARKGGLFGKGERK